MVLAYEWGRTAPEDYTHFLLLRHWPEFGPMIISKPIPSKKDGTVFRRGFLNLDTTDIWDQIIFLWELPNAWQEVYQHPWMLFSKCCAPSPLWQPKMSLDIAKCPWRTKLSLIENYRFRWIKLIPEAKEELSFHCGTQQFKRERGGYSIQSKILLRKKHKTTAMCRKNTI